MFCCFSFFIFEFYIFSFFFFYFVSIYFIFCSLINPSLFFTCFILFFDSATVKQKMTGPVSNRKWQCHCPKTFLYIYIYMQFVFACFCCFFLLLPLCLVCTNFSSIFWANQQKRRGAAQWGEGAQPTKPILSQWTCGCFNNKNMLSMISYTWL